MIAAQRRAGAPAGGRRARGGGLAWVAALALVAACAASHENAFPERARPTPPASPEARSQPAPGESRARWSGPADCTITRALPASCAACARGNCCSPPVPFSRSVATALSCMTRCREPLPPQEPPLGEEDIAAVRDACRAQCADDSAETSGLATLLDRCLFERCSSECRGR